MKKITLLFLLMFGLSGLVNGQNTVKKIQSSSPSVVNYQNSNFGNDFSRMVGCDGVLPNYTNSMLTGSAVASQIFPDFSNSTLQSADDFMVVGTQDAVICQIDVTGQFFNGATTLDDGSTSIQMTIYNDAAGMPDSVLFTENFPGSIAGPMSPSFSLSPTGAPTLTAGTTYWMSIQVIMPFTPSGQWGWAGTTDGNGSAYMFQDPDGIASACPSWALGSTCTSEAGPDLAMDISFNAVGGGGGSCTEAESFITTWKTTVPGETITIPTFPTESYSYTVDWGDSLSSVHIGDATHSYANAGIHTVKICGTFPRIYFNNGGDRLKIQSIEQWGPNVWSSMNGAFAGAENLVSIATDMPNLSMVTDMYGMFAFARKFNGDANFGNWIVANVTDMSAMFAGASKFNHDINGWNVGNVITMEDMFKGASKFNQDLNSWNVSSVTNMKNLFSAALEFDGDVSSWIVGSVTNMYGTFSHCPKFNQDISGWNVENVTDMHGMLAYARMFNKNIGNWDVSKVTDMTAMLAATSVFNQDIGNWDVDNVTSMKNMFNGSTLFNQDISSWNVGKVRNMQAMFRTALHFNQDIGNWDVSRVLNMEEMFAFTIRFDQDLGNWNVIKLLKAKNMFKKVKLSTINYDALLIGWSGRVLNNGVKFSGGLSNYCSNAALNAKNHMENFYDWEISDAGQLCPPAPLMGDRLNVGNNGDLLGVVLYPNPMANELVLTNSENKNLESVSIYDLTGRLIQTTDLKGMASEKILDVSNLSRSTYLVMIKSEAGQISKLVVKD